MKINYESNSSDHMYQTGNVIRQGNDGLYLIANNKKKELFTIDLINNQVYGPYTTMDDLYHCFGNADDVLVHAEINVL
ncbi:hypothetical protein [Ligilactobacillus salivarius]|uniref:Uncharacterized protein n=1 Tax=Ligilactobacillus salivarius TaxID=1624 RepID=A0A1V9U179_9LACO|nr:hypothetical protein [Ligilactobacillus salivarius]OQR21590.1 hypothetical protein B6U39_03990 [Ligilactobacillus salivarius]OQR23665.1 hypothetical protein B6U38_04020 [Ligilactobacillus salivarius]OQR25658.1 hypothetical protein B6U37_04005 [Ligilactobacillus salivarius]